MEALVDSGCTMVCPDSLQGSGEELRLTTVILQTMDRLGSLALASYL